MRPLPDEIRTRSQPALIKLEAVEGAEWLHGLHGPWGPSDPPHRMLGIY